MTQVACPRCSQVLKVTANNSGLNVKCPCGTLLKMPVLPETPIAAEMVEVIEEDYQLQPEQGEGLFGAVGHSSRKKGKVRPQMLGNSKWQTPTSRTYYHLQCNQHTTVTEFDHIYVTNIFSHPESTYCSHCNNQFPVSDYCWSNTNEKLTDYYARYQSKYTDFERLMCGGMFAIVGTAAIGVVFAMVCFLISTMVAGPMLGVIGAVVGGVLGGGGAFLLVAKIIESVDERVVGTSKYEMLR